MGTELHVRRRRDPDRSVRWYGNTSSAPPADYDGDGVTECSDCNDFDPATWDTPGEITGCAFLGDGGTMGWQPPAMAPSSSVTYDTLRSAAASDFMSEAAICLESFDGTDTLAADPKDPPPGGVFYYLVRARNECPYPLGIGSVGADSSGAPRAAHPARRTPARRCSEHP